MSTSLQTLIQDAAAHYQAFGGTQNPSSGTSATVFVMAGASSHYDESDENTLMEDVWVKCESDSAVTPLNVGEVRRIKSYVASTQAVTLPTSHGFTSTPTATQLMGFYYGIPPVTRWRNIHGWPFYINRVLASLRYKRLGMLTLVTDGDMDSSGTTNWTASTATLSKITAAANITFGTQSMRVLCTSASGYAKSAAINVGSSALLYARADVRVAVGTASLVVWDETNNASLGSATSTNADWRTINVNVTVPSTCKSVTVRLTGTGASDDAYWDDVSLLTSATLRLPLPSWVDHPRAILSLNEYRGFFALGTLIAQSSTKLIPVPYDRIIWDETAATPMWIELSGYANGLGIQVIEGLSRYSTLTTDASTTTADEDMVIHGACWLAASDRNDPRAEGFLAEFRAAAGARLPRSERWIQ